MSIENRLREANGRLRTNHCGVNIEQVGGKLYLRAVLPPKPKSKQVKHHQQRISIAPANFEGVKIAEREAKKISSELANNKFEWGNYLEEIKFCETIGEWVAKFEEDYFNRRERTLKTETTWKVEYTTVFKVLPKDEIISTEILKQAILKTNPDTRTRKRFCLVTGLLAKFAGLDFNSSVYAGDYSPKRRKPRDLPTDKKIAEWYLKIENHKWRWVFGMLATYGLRNHEVFFLDLDQLREGNQVLTVLDGKTGYRRVWPFHPEWFTEFDLASVKLPEINLDRNNSSIGGTVSQHFRRNQEIPFKVYDLRHSWAIRTLEYGIDISLAAQQMGHSLNVHSTLYHTWITSRIHQQAFDLAMQKSDRPKPPKF